MAVLLTTSYQEVATGTKSFTADGYSQTCRLTTYAKYQKTEEKTQIVVKITAKSTKSGYSWTSSANTVECTLDGTKKTKEFNIGTVTTTEKTLGEFTFDVDDGTFEDKTLIGACDVYGSVKPTATGTLSLPIFNNMRIGFNGVIKEVMAHLGVNGTAKKCDVYIGVNGTPKKCG